MPTTIDSVIDAFQLLYSSFLRQDFSKSLFLYKWEERKLLPLVRTFLLGYFGEKLQPEVSVALPGCPSGNGRIDFLVDDVAVEFAVRTPNAPASKVSATTSQDEIRKLLKFEGKSVLVLFDFSESPYNSQELEEFRICPLGKGNHNKYPYKLAYFYLRSLKPKACGMIKKQIRIC
jgi:hypothetical protein